MPAPHAPPHSPSLACEDSLTGGRSLAGGRSLTLAAAAALFQAWPSYEDIHRKMIEVATFLDLPRFPAITEDCYLHPNILCRKYLMEVNLPGKKGCL